MNSRPGGVPRSELVAEPELHLERRAWGVSREDLPERLRGRVLVAGLKEVHVRRAGEAAVASDGRRTVVGDRRVELVERQVLGVEEVEDLSREDEALALAEREALLHAQVDVIDRAVAERVAQEIDARRAVGTVRVLSVVVRVEAEPRVDRRAREQADRARDLEAVGQEEDR